MKFFLFLTFSLLFFFSCGTKNKDSSSVVNEVFPAADIEVEGSTKYTIEYCADSIEEYSAFENTDINNTDPRSYLRPDEKIEKGKQYSDTLEYIDYNGDGDFDLVTVKKGEMHIVLMFDYHSLENVKLNRGDIISFQWELRTFSPAGDSEAIWTLENCTFLKVVEEGELSIFRKKNKKSLVYNFAESVMDYQVFVKEKVDFFLANGGSKVTANMLRQGNILEIGVTEKKFPNNEEKFGVQHVFYSVDIQCDSVLVDNFVMRWDKIYRVDEENKKLIEVDMEGSTALNAENLLIEYFAENPFTRTFLSDEEIQELDENINKTKPGRSSYKSPLRGNEQLYVGIDYTDEVEFIYFEGDYDYYSIIVKKGDDYISLYIDDFCVLNRGDIITLNWRMDSYFVAGDGESEWIGEWVSNIKLKSEGGLSKYLKAQKYKNLEGLTIPEGVAEWSFVENKKRIFNFLATTSNRTIRNAVDVDEKLLIKMTNISLKVAEEDLKFHQVDFIKEGEPKIIATLFLSRNYEDSDAVYEYDQKNNKLNKFSKY